MGASFRESPVAAGSWPSSPERDLGKTRDHVALVWGTAGKPKASPKVPFPEALPLPLAP